MLYIPYRTYLQYIGSVSLFAIRPPPQAVRKQAATQSRTSDVPTWFRDKPRSSTFGCLPETFCTGMCDVADSKMQTVSGDAGKLAYGRRTRVKPLMMKYAPHSLVAIFTVLVMVSGSLEKTTIVRNSFTKLFTSFSDSREPVTDSSSDGLRSDVRYPQCMSRASGNNSSVSAALPSAVLQNTTFPPPLPLGLPESLARYVVWHARARACFLSDGQDGGCEEVVRGSDGAHNGMPGLLIWRCKSRQMCAGIGDRLRGIDSLFLMAVFTKRLFLIDVRQGVNDRLPLTLAIVPALLDWTLPPALEPASLPHSHSLDWHNVHSPHALPALSAGAFDPYEDDARAAFGGRRIVSVACNVGRNIFSAIRATRYSQNGTNTLDSLTTIRNPDLNPSVLSDLGLAHAFAQILYRPSDAVAPAIQRILNKVARVSAGSRTLPFVAVHVRTGEQMGESHVSRFSKMRDTERVSRALVSCVRKSVQVCSAGKKGRDCVRRNGTPGTRPLARGIFITGDDPGVKNKVAEIARDAGFDRVFIAGSATHVGLPSDKLPNNLAHPDVLNACENLLDVFVDLVVMSHAQAIVSTGSGFARAAYVWGNASVLNFAFSNSGAPACVLMPIR